MNDPIEGPGTRQKESPKRMERAHRILDAAADLILRWGYNKTAIDDIARQAGVAKGTIYLHWKTREELFQTLIKREQVVIGQDIRQRLVGDPAGVTLRGIYKHSALALMKRPLMKAVLLRDMDVLGKLAHTSYGSAAYAERLSGFYVYLDFLRKHDLVRGDLSVQAQVVVMSSVIMGFFVTMPLMPDELTLSDEEIADLIGETVHRTLETDRAISPDEYQNISDAFIQYFDSVMTTAAEELRLALEPASSSEKEASQ